MSVLHELVRRIERAEALDRVSKPVTTLVGRAVRPRAVRNLLSGTTLGHPAHPMATDVPIGAWSMATLLDLAGGRDTRRAADLLVATGIAAAVPAAAAGANDWSDTYGPETPWGWCTPRRTPPRSVSTRPRWQPGCGPTAGPGSYSGWPASRS
jgi:hypothetical protein